jgi:hypothetical protein
MFRPTPLMPGCGSSLAESASRLEGFRQSRLRKETICGMAADDPDRHWEPALGDGTVPDFMTAFA